MRVRIRKTGIQNVDEMPLTRNNNCLKGGEEESSAGRPPDQQTEMQKLEGMKCTSKSTPLSLVAAAVSTQACLGACFSGKKVSSTSEAFSRLF